MNGYQNIQNTKHSLCCFLLPTFNNTYSNSKASPPLPSLYPCAWQDKCLRWISFMALRQQSKKWMILCLVSDPVPVSKQACYRPLNWQSNVKSHMFCNVFDLKIRSFLLVACGPDISKLLKRTSRLLPLSASRVGQESSKKGAKGQHTTNSRLRLHWISRIFSIVVCLRVSQNSNKRNHFKTKG